MNDDQKGPLAVPETTYLPPPRPETGTASGEPAETQARSPESTVQDAPAAAPALDDSQIATIDMAPSAPPAADESVTLPTIDQSGPSPTSSAVMPPIAVRGRRIGEYDVLGELGRGGMGVVYKARHRQLGRVVALKMIRTGAHADADEIGRFLAEAQAVARLQHPGIVQIFDIGQHDGLPFFSLELVDGGSLPALIAKEPLEAREAAQMVEQLAQAMQYAHDRGILHRDLKPANVLLTSGGQPKITDFGLAKQLESMDSGSTQTGTVMGTPSYMSPEQARGDVRELTPATDQYSLGAVLYHLLTGRPPFLAAKAVETVLSVIHDEPVAPRQLVPKLPADLETICLKTLHKDSQRRYASCTELAADLRRFLAGEPIIARPVGQVERLWRWCQRNPRVAIPTAASILLFLIAFGISIGAAWSLSKLNADLKQQTKVAQTQTGIAKANEAKAKTAEDDAKKQEKVANDNAGVALNTIKQVFVEVQSGVGRNPALQPFKKRLIESATKDLESLKDSIGTSGITGAATTLAYHELMSQLYRDGGETEKAWNHISLAHEIARKRIKDQQGSTASRLNLARICQDMASIQQAYDRDMHVSLAYSEEAARVLEDVLAKPKPALSDQLRMEILFHQLDPAYTAIGTTYIRLGDPVQALACFERARQVRDNILKDAAYLRLPAQTRAKNEFAFREKSAKDYWALGDLHYRMQQPEKGRVYLEKSLEIYRDLLDTNPQEPTAKQNVLSGSSQAGYWIFVSGDAEKARPLYERALDLAKELDNDFPNNAPIRATLALVQYRLGILKKSEGDATAKENFETCLKIRTELAKDAANVKRQKELMLILARTGQRGNATALAKEILGQVKEPDIELLLDLARAYAQCSASDPSAAGAEAFRVNAIYVLSEAVNQGHEDPITLATEPDYVPLRDLPEFQALVAKEKAAVAAKPKKE